VTHTHTVDRETGPQCCKDGVSYRQRCSCGCVRTRCTCTQCYSTWGTHKGDWSMPTCSACGYHHSADEPCTTQRVDVTLSPAAEEIQEAIARATGPHTDLDTIDLDHDLGTRDLTSQFGEEE
jgi:hypothetical protein